MSLNYSATIRIDVIKSDVEVTIFGEKESVRLLDSWLQSRIGGLSKVGSEGINNVVEVITYEDATGKNFDKAD